MKGFNPEFKNLTDYILKITYQIWESRQIDKIRDWYGKTAPVYTPTNVTEDVEEVIRSTLQTLYIFPDRQLLGEDVIGSEAEAGLFYSSHRIYSTMTHLGDGVFGKPSGNTVQTRTIADCVCQENKVIEEWMVRDQSAIVKSIGLNPQTFGQEQAKALREMGLSYQADNFVQRWRGGPKPKSASEQIEKLKNGFKKIWETSQVSLLETLYDRAATSHVAGGQILNGIDQIKRYLIDWKASFPQAEYEVQHWIEDAEPAQPIRIAFRWTMKAKHSGYGYFGAPSNKEITIMAISHFELRNGVILRDYHLIDELSIWGQIETNQ